MLQEEYEEVSLHGPKVNKRAALSPKLALICATAVKTKLTKLTKLGRQERQGRTTNAQQRPRATNNDQENMARHYLVKASVLMEIPPKATPNTQFHGNTAESHAQQTVARGGRRRNEEEEGGGWRRKEEQGQGRTKKKEEEGGGRREEEEEDEEKT
jgi:hypothetical protein